MNYETELRNKNRGYMKLIVWQKAMQLFELVWTIVSMESKIDLKLRSPIVDAAQSISANISEGYARCFISEYIQSLYYALGSLAEKMTRAIGLKQTGQILPDRVQEFNVPHYETEKRLFHLIDKLEHKRDDEDWIARIAEDAEECVITPPFHHSTTPSLQSHA